MTEKISYELITSYFKNEIASHNNIDKDELKYISLNDAETNKLNKKISLMPYKEKSLLYMKYVFDESPLVVADILEIEDTKGRVLYLNKLLAQLLGYKDYYIDESTLKDVVNEGFQLEQTENHLIELKTVHSYSFIERMSNMGIKIYSHKNRFGKMLKRVAIIFLTIGLSLSLFFTVNVKAREELLGWIVETFPEYSIFSSNKLKDGEIKNLTSDDVIINYLPERFTLKNTLNITGSIRFEYITNLKAFVKDKNVLSLVKQESNGIKLELLKYEVKEVDIVKNTDFSYDVHIKIEYDYMDGDMKSSITSGYKINVVEEKGMFKIRAAMSNDLSSGTIFPETIIQDVRELNYDYQISNKTTDKGVTDKPYNLNNIISDYRQYVEEIDAEDLNIDEDQNILRVGNNKYFATYKSENIETAAKELLTELLDREFKAYETMGELNLNDILKDTEENKLYRAYNEWYIKSNNAVGTVYEKYRYEIKPVSVNGNVIEFKVNSIFKDSSSSLENSFYDTKYILELEIVDGKYIIKKLDTDSYFFDRFKKLYPENMSIEEYTKNRIESSIESNSDLDKIVDMESSHNNLNNDVVIPSEEIVKMRKSD